MAELQENDDYGFVDVPVPKKPPQERPNNQFRPFVFRSNFLDKVAGSGYVELGDTCVLCSVEGPNEKDRETDDDIADDSAVIVISDELCDEYVTALDQIIDTFVRTELLVNAEVKVFVKVISDDGGVLAATTMAVGLALASANIQMFDLPLAATVLVEQPGSERLILDPTAAQCEEAKKRDGGIGHTLSEGVMSVKQAKKATEIAFKASLMLHAEVGNTLKESL
ncbi:3' exoribonuclease [Aphelenchoides fujianensis]|nr:3' exoribonuclease [Aphelenchoides fujianensis]